LRCDRTELATLREASRDCLVEGCWLGSAVAARETVVTGRPSELESSLGGALRVDQSAKPAAVANAASTAVSLFSIRNI
jgi:hypothetical protein